MLGERTREPKPDWYGMLAMVVSGFISWLSFASLTHAVAFVVKWTVEVCGYDVTRISDWIKLTPVVIVSLVGFYPLSLIITKSLNRFLNEKHKLPNDEGAGCLLAVTLYIFVGALLKLVFHVNILDVLL